MGEAESRIDTTKERKFEMVISEKVGDAALAILLHYKLSYYHEKNCSSSPSPMKKLGWAHAVPLVSGGPTVITESNLLFAASYLTHV